MTGSATGDRVARRRPRLNTEPPFRDVRFWIVQTLVFGITVLHGVTEWIERERGLSGLLEGVHQLPIAAYIIPILLAGLWYGLRGAIPTGIVAIVLSVPNLVLFHRTDFEWLGESTSNALSVAAGLVVASVVERNFALRRRAETDRARLATLWEVTGSMSRAEDEEGLIQGIVDRLGASLPLGGVAFVFPDPERRPIVAAGSPGARSRLTDWASNAGHVEQGQATDVVAFDVATVERDFGRLVCLCDGAGVPVQDEVVVSLIANELAAVLEVRSHRAQEQSRLREYARAVTLAQEGERSRIARELHDGPTQWMVAITRIIGRLRVDPAVPDRSDEEIDELLDLVQNSSQSLRRMIRALRPPVLDDLGLVAALRSLVDRRSRQSGIPIHFEVSGEESRLDTDVELAAYRIAQEALTNVEKHAGDAAATVHIAISTDGCLLEVTDTGRGFDAGDVPADGEHFGLVSMTERAELVGGRLDIVSTPGQGTTVTMSVP